MLTALAVLGGFGLDLLLADPAWMPHPVVLMGKVIARLENLLRRLFPDTPAGLLAAGRVLALRRLSALWPIGFTRLWDLQWNCSGAGRRWLCRAWPMRAAGFTRL